MRPYYWKERIFISLLCAGAVLVLSLGGCKADRPVDISACYQRCAALGGERCGSQAFGGWGEPARYCVCTCSYDMPFADGGHP